MLMYKLNEVVYLSKEENDELLSNELHLTKVNHVDNIEDVPVNEYPFKYIVGKDIDLF